MKQSKQGEWKSGIWHPKVNNPQGHNKHTPQKDLIKNIFREIQVITKESVQQAYRELLIAKRNVLSKAHTYHRMHKMFLGLDVVEKEFDNQGGNKHANKN